MVEGAGVWRVGSKPPGQPGWAIRPFQGEASVILLPNRALAVRSCDNGGEFAPTRCWVIASSAVEAHAIAQFVCKMNPSDVRGWLETLAGAQARFEMPDETGFIRIYETPGFRSQILFSGDNTSR